MWYTCTLVVTCNLFNQKRQPGDSKWETQEAFPYQAFYDEYVSAAEEQRQPWKWDINVNISAFFFLLPSANTKAVVSVAMPCLGLQAWIWSILKYRATMCCLLLQWRICSTTRPRTFSSNILTRHPTPTWWNRVIWPFSGDISIRHGRISTQCNSR